MHRDFLGIKKLHFNMIPIDFATVFATCDISDFQFMFASKTTPYLWMLFHFNHKTNSYQPLSQQV